MGVTDNSDCDHDSASEEKESDILVALPEQAENLGESDSGPLDHSRSRPRVRGTLVSSPEPSMAKIFPVIFNGKLFNSPGGGRIHTGRFFGFKISHRRSKVTLSATSTSGQRSSSVGRRPCRYCSVGCRCSGGFRSCQAMFFADLQAQGPQTVLIEGTAMFHRIHQSASSCARRAPGCLGGNPRGRRRSTFRSASNFITRPTHLQRIVEPTLLELRNACILSRLALFLL
jgi:hypothetical protein